MPTPLNRSFRLPPDQYFPAGNAKTGIALHHTVGGSARSTFEYWRTSKDQIGTAYLIERDGTVFEVFDPTAWAWQFGLPWSSEDRLAFEKRFIGIELACEGALKESNGRLYCFDRISDKTETGRDEAFDYGQGFRGYRYFQRYTVAQVSSLISLVNDLCAQFNIERKIPDNFLNYYGDQLKMFKGVIGHTMVRTDKTDPLPDISYWKYVAASCGLQTVAISGPVAVSSTAGSSLSALDKDRLLDDNSIELNKLDIGAGSLVKGLIMELRKDQNNTFIKLRDPVEDGFVIAYDFLQGDKSLVSRLGNALGFKDVTADKLEVFNA